MKNVNLFGVLRRPAAALKELGAYPKNPWALWMQCGAIAIFGSLFFGLSLIRFHPDWDATGSSLWFTLSAGSSWIIFGPLLRLCTGLPWRVLGQACLVTMVFGEIVLITGACFQLFFYPGRGSYFAIASAVGWVLFSNLIMGIGLAVQLKAMEVSVFRTSLCWIFGLNGLGTAFFFLFRGLTEARV